MTGYEKLLKTVNKSRSLCFILKFFCYFATFECINVFIYLLDRFYSFSFSSFLGAIITLGVPFLIVTLVRRYVDAKRPYEIYDFFDKKPKEKQGNSFPSRHAFSIFAIGTLCIFVDFQLGIITLILGVIMCICRVLLGIHFIRDVFAGAIIGVISSLIGALILI